MAESGKEGLVMENKDELMLTDLIDAKTLQRIQEDRKSVV